MEMANGSDANEAEATPVAAPGDKQGARKRVRMAPKPVKRQNEISSIGFPYMSLEAGISIARAVLGAGGVPLSREQLAGVMSSSSGSGTFLMKITTARTFGLISYVQGKYELTNLGFSIVDTDEKRQRTARAESFLTVALFRRVYEEFKGKQLPPRPHGLEQAFVKFGVAPKQANYARLAFDKSAQQAGFFAAGPDRLIEPIMGAVPPADRNRPPTDENDGDSDRGRATVKNGAPETSGLHPFVQGLLNSLPEPNTNWTVEGRAKWLQAAANIFDLMYKGNGEIHITAKGEQERKE
jgi:hypothetical protein